MSTLPPRLLILMLFALPCSVAARTVVVDTIADDPTLTACDDAVSNDCSLRGAILAANERPLSETSTIDIPAGTYVLSQSSSCTYKHHDNPSEYTTSEVPLCVASNVTLQGAGVATIIDGNQAHRVFFVSADAKVQLSGVTIAHGLSDRSFGLNADGGGIVNEGTLTLTDSVVRDNSLDPAAGGAGGAGIYNASTLTLLRSAVSANVANAAGGGIFNDQQAILTVSGSTISNNVVLNNGGGIFNFNGSVTITDSTMSGNTTTNGGGGGIYNSGGNFIGTLTMINSTISGNTSGSTGGGIANNFLTVAELNNVTITSNTALRAFGGGVENQGMLTIQNTVIAGNDAPIFPATSDCSTSTALVSLGYNLIQNSDACTMTGDLTGNVVGQDPRLGLLLENGGLTKTHALIDGSPAIDAGNPVAPGSGGAACAATDQRGFLRPLGTACDIGAFERSSALSVARIQPKTGGNTGTVSAFIAGDGFVDGVTVMLTRAGQTDIVGTPAQRDAGGSAIVATFDLAGRPTGGWDVVVKNPDGASQTLIGAFTLEAGGAPDLWVNVIGRIRRVGPSRLTIQYGNRGSIDAVGTPLSLSIPVGYAPSRFFAIAPPPPQPGQQRDDWSQVPLTVLTDAESGFLNIPLLLPVVPAGFAGMVQIGLTFPPAAPDSLLVAAIGDPLFAPGLDPQVVSDAVAGAQAYLQNVGVTVPPALVPELELYVSNQLERVVERGRTAFVAGLGTEPQVYGVSQLHFDLILFGAALAADTQASASLGTSASWLSAIYGSLVSVVSRLPQAEARAQQQNCPVARKGDVLMPGCSGGPGPDEPFLPPAIPPPPGCNLKDRSTFKNCMPTEAHCEALLGQKVVRDANGNPFCVPKEPRDGCSSMMANPIGGNQGCLRFPLRPKNSVDPNDKVGTLGATPAQFLLSATPLSYDIHFENLETATGAAQEVVITDQLDVEKVDLDTFSLGPIAFGDRTLTPAPGVQQYTGGVDLRPDQNLVVTIQASVNKDSGLITWRFTSIDPDTGQLTEDPDAGFLPPNVSPPGGEGSVVFTVQPKSGLATGTEIRNHARVVFDLNAPLETPEWLNTIDASAPSSQVLPLASPQSSASFLLEWAGTDDGAGILDYSIFVSVEGGAFTALLSNTTDTSATFSGELGRTYAFYSVARDLAGNVEDAPAVADALTALTTGTPTCIGDCDGNGRVAINELVLGVKIVLGSQSVGACSAFVNSREMVDVAQLVKGVNNALNGCGG